MNQPTLQLSIVVPTFREADNLETLVTRVFAAVHGAGIEAEMIIVDDNSDDGSEQIVEGLSEHYPVKIIVRTQERGLSTAVLRGFEDARGEILLVMDADLSHPPDKVPDLYRMIAEDRADFVIGSRYTEGGETTEDWPWYRQINSWGATVLARPLTPSRDPMAGFFCLRHATYKRAESLNPLGYKIGLELMVKARCSNIQEIAIVFQDRHAGESKMSFTQQLLYIWHLKRLYDFKFPLMSVLVFYLLPLVLVSGLVYWLVA